MKSCCPKAPLKNISVMKIRNEREKIESFKNRLLQHPRLDAVTSSSNKLGERIWIWDFRPDGWTEAQNDWMVQAQGVSHDYLKTYGIDLVEGRDFSPEFLSDTNNSVIINQTAAKALGWEDPIGKTMLTPVQLGRNRAHVIGVVKDFHFVSLHQKIEPLVLMLSNRLRFVSIKVNAAELKSTTDYIGEQWNGFEPNVPFNYEFVDEKLAHLYQSEENMGTITGYFSAFAVFVACLGLLGLVSFATEQKKKEIGIRKVLGASVTRVVYLISKEFLKLILIAFVIAAPLSYFFMSRWLEDFAYRTEINPWVFIAAGLAVVFVAVVTLIFQAIKAAAANPVNSLRYE